MYVVFSLKTCGATYYTDKIAWFLVFNAQSIEKGHTKVNNKSQNHNEKSGSQFWTQHRQQQTKPSQIVTN